MDSRNSTGAGTARTLYQPQTDEDGRAYVIVVRPDSKPERRPFHSKEAACFWARQWMRRERLAQLEGAVFGTAWIDPGAQH